MKNAETLNSERVYTGQVFNVHRDRITLPNGRTVTVDIVRHAQSVVVAPVPEPGKIILIRQYRYPVNKLLWELPAGSVDPGEHPTHAARRECHEEIGLVPRTIRHLTTLYPTPGFCTERMLFYLCTDLEEPSTEAHQDEDEDLEPRTVTLDEAWAMVDRGEIADLKTVTALTLAARA